MCCGGWRSRTCRRAKAVPAVDPNARNPRRLRLLPRPVSRITAAKLKLKPGMGDEYKKRHDAIWPELSKAIRDAGISDYSIFLDEETGTLFAVQKVDDEQHHRRTAQERTHEAAGGRTWRTSWK